MQGFLHPEGVYDDSAGGKLREAIYLRLRSHFQFENQLLLFAEVHHNTKFSINTYGEASNANFVHIANLFHPSTINLSFGHHGNGEIPGIKKADNSWNQEGHRQRLVPVNEHNLSLFAQLYDDPGTPALEARLPALHAAILQNILTKLAHSERKVNTQNLDSSVLWIEHMRQKDGTIVRDAGFPEGMETLILSGPCIYVGTPLYKTPRQKCVLNSDYDCLDVLSHQVIQRAARPGAAEG